MSQGQIPGFPSQGLPPSTNEPPQLTTYLSDGTQQASAIRAGSNPYINRSYEPITSTTTSPSQPAPSSWAQSSVAAPVAQEQPTSSSWPPPVPIQQSEGRKTSDAKRVRFSEPSSASSTPTVWGDTKYGTNKKRTNENDSPKLCCCDLKTSLTTMAAFDLIAAISCCIATIVMLMSLNKTNLQYVNNKFQLRRDIELFLNTGLGTSAIIILASIGLLIGAVTRTYCVAVSSSVIGWIAFLGAIVVYCLTFLVKNIHGDVVRWISLIGMIVALVYRIYETIVLAYFVKEPAPKPTGPVFVDGESTGRSNAYPAGTYPAGNGAYPAGTYPAGGYAPPTVVAVPPFGGYANYDPLYSTGGIGLGLGYGGLGYGGFDGYYGGYGYDPFDYHHHHGLFDHHHHGFFDHHHHWL